MAGHEIFSKVDVEASLTGVLVTRGADGAPFVVSVIVAGVLPRPT
jgi:hypothetical protein